MRNRSSLLLTIVLLVVFCGCPTRTVYYPDGGRETGGSGGSGTASGGAETTGQGVGGGGGISEAGGNGGAAGAGGLAGASETGGGGEAGAAGHGGQAGSGSIGGIGGQAGAAGSGGTAGAPASGGGSGTGGPPTRAKDGTPCALPSDCASATCTPFYVDVDGDGYGYGQAAGFCGTTAPVGYAAQSGDCCDTATNLAIAKLIHPGADFQTTSAGGVCNITWDYNCSGTVEMTSTNLAGCTPYPDCKDVRGPFPESDCGQRVAVASCGTSTTNMSSCITSGGSVTLGCK